MQEVISKLTQIRFVGWSALFSFDSIILKTEDKELAIMIYVLEFLYEDSTPHFLFIVGFNVIWMNSDEQLDNDILDSILNSFDI